MNRRMMMGGDGSLNTPMRGGEEGSGEWQDWLADDGPLQDEAVADAEEAQQRHAMLAEARSEEHTSELQSLMRHSYAVFCLQKKTHRSRSQARKLTER